MSSIRLYGPYKQKEREAGEFYTLNTLGYRCKIIAYVYNLLGGYNAYGEKWRFISFLDFFGTFDDPVYANSYDWRAAEKEIIEGDGDFDHATYFKKKKELEDKYPHDWKPSKDAKAIISIDFAQVESRTMAYCRGMNQLAEERAAREFERLSVELSAFHTNSALLQPPQSMTLETLREAMALLPRRGPQRIIIGDNAMRQFETAFGIPVVVNPHLPPDIAVVMSEDNSGSRSHFITRIIGEEDESQGQEYTGTTDALARIASEFTPDQDEGDGS